MKCVYPGYLLKCVYPISPEILSLITLRTVFNLITSCSAFTPITSGSVFGLFQWTRANISTCWLTRYIKSAAVITDCQLVTAGMNLIAWPLLSTCITQHRMTTQSAILMLSWENGGIIWRVRRSIILGSSFEFRNEFKYYIKVQSVPHIKQWICFLTAKYCNYVGRGK